ncbi:hypothetical protein C0J52_22640 [Blattella germanica]|nr:hypothetical protein C0J52_22640 [Blattella germanica]
MSMYEDYKDIEEAQVSYRCLEDALSDEKALYSKKLEKLESTQHGELAARNTKHSCKLAKCEYLKPKFQSFFFMYMCLLVFSHIHFLIIFITRWAKALVPDHVHWFKSPCANKFSQGF